MWGGNSKGAAEECDDAEARMREKKMTYDCEYKECFLRRVDLEERRREGERGRKEGREDGGGGKGGEEERGR